MMRIRKAGWSNVPECDWWREGIENYREYDQWTQADNYTFGRHVFLGHNAIIDVRKDGNVAIGSNVWIGHNVCIEGWDVTIGSNVGIGPGVVILSSQHTGIPVTTPAFQTDLQIEPVVICDGVDIGANATILPGVTIGEGSIIGAGAVVTKDVPPWEVWCGNPARKLKMRGE